MMIHAMCALRELREMREIRILVRGGVLKRLMSNSP
jgi:hypothetical protein